MAQRGEELVLHPHRLVEFLVLVLELPGLQVDALLEAGVGVAQSFLLQGKALVLVLQFVPVLENAFRHPVETLAQALELVAGAQLGAGGVIARLQPPHHSREGLDRTDDRVGQRELQEDGDEGNDTDAHPHRRHPVVGVQRFLGFQCLQLGGLLLLDLPGQVANLVEQGAAGGVELRRVGRLALGLIHGVVADLRHPFSHQRAALALEVGGQNQRRVEGVEIGLQRGADLSVKGEIVGITGRLIGASLRVHGGQERGDGLDAFELDLVGAGLGGVELHPVERSDEINREKEKQREVAKQAEHEAPRHAELDAAGFERVLGRPQAKDDSMAVDGPSIRDGPSLQGFHLPPIRSETTFPTADRPLTQRAIRSLESRGGASKIPILHEAFFLVTRGSTDPGAA